MLGRWRRKREASTPDGRDDSVPAEDAEYTADPRELVGPEGVTVAESPDAAGERRVAEP